MDWSICWPTCLCFFALSPAGRVFLAVALIMDFRRLESAFLNSCKDSPKMLVMLSGSAGEGEDGMVVAES